MLTREPHTRATVVASQSCDSLCRGILEMSRWFALLVLIVATLVAPAQNTGSAPTSDDATATATLRTSPLTICSKTHPADKGNCSYSCKDKKRPSSGVCVIPPQATSTPDPEYSDVARREHIEGTVYLEVTVDPNGRPTEIKVVRSLEPSLDRSAVNAVGQWKFKPGLLEGKPVAVKLDVEVSFRMYFGPVPPR